jgi:hypothetical protein
MRLEEFNKLSVTSIVWVPVKKGAMPANVPAYSINRTAKKIKPFMSNKWYSYKYVNSGPTLAGVWAGLYGKHDVVEILQASKEKNIEQDTNWSYLKQYG